MPKIPSIRDFKTAEREMGRLLEKKPNLSLAFVLATVIEEHVLSLTERQENELTRRFSTQN